MAVGLGINAYLNTRTTYTATRGGLHLIRFKVPLRILARFITGNFRYRIAISQARRASVRAGSVAAIILRKDGHVIEIHLPRDMITGFRRVSMTHRPLIYRFQDRYFHALRANPSKRLGISASTTVIYYQRRLNASMLNARRAYRGRYNATYRGHRAVTRDPIRPILVPRIGAIRHALGQHVRHGRRLALLFLRARGLHARRQNR